MEITEGKKTSLISNISRKKHAHKEDSIMKLRLLMSLESTMESFSAWNIQISHYKVRGAAKAQNSWSLLYLNATKLSWINHILEKYAKHKRKLMWHLITYKCKSLWWLNILIRMKYLRHPLRIQLTLCTI